MAEKDTRTYIRVHDGMPDHPKIDGLSDAAFRLLVTMWCWCSRHLTDGVVPAGTWQKRGTSESRAELLMAGLAEERLDGAVLMHDYTDHQRTADEVRELREKRREAGSKGGKAKANALASAKANALADALANGKQNSAIDIDIDISKNSLAQPDGFAEFWMAYPRRIGKGQATKAWATAMKRGADPRNVVAAAAVFARSCAGKDPKFIPHPTTWLNGERYDDEPEAGQVDPVEPRRHPPEKVPDDLDPDDIEAYRKWLREG